MFLLLISKSPDVFVTQNPSKQQANLEFKLDTLLETYSFDSPLQKIQGIWMLSSNF